MSKSAINQVYSVWASVCVCVCVCVRACARMNIHSIWCINIYTLHHTMYIYTQIQYTLCTYPRTTVDMKIDAPIKALQTYTQWVTWVCILRYLNLYITSTKILAYYIVSPWKYFRISMFHESESFVQCSWKMSKMSKISTIQTSNLKF